MGKVGRWGKRGSNAADLRMLSALIFCSVFFDHRGSGPMWDILGVVSREILDRFWINSVVETTDFAKQIQVNHDLLPAQEVQRIGGQ